MPLLLYADDLELISRSAVGLQSLLHTLHQVCTYHRLQKSINKTEAPVCQQCRPALSNLTTLYCNCKPLKKSSTTSNLASPWTPRVHSRRALCKCTVGCFCCAASVLSAGHLLLGLHPQAVQGQCATHLVKRLRGLVWHLLQRPYQAAVGRGSC